MNRVRPLPAFALALVAVSTAACLDDDITGARPISFSLSAPVATAQVGDSVTFAFEATGTGILGVVMSYGDGAVDSIDVAAQSGGGNIVEYSAEPRYAYTTSGMFEVIGELVTSAGSLSDTVEVNITP